MALVYYMKFYYEHFYFLFVMFGVMLKLDLNFQRVGSITRIYCLNFCNQYEYNLLDDKVPNTIVCLHSHMKVFFLNIRSGFPVIPYAGMH